MELLSGLGIDARAARVLAFIARAGEGASVQIERSCNLRQPEVSLATKSLRDRGWLAVRERRRGGKGRPAHVYRLETPLCEIVDRLEADKRAELSTELRKIQRLRTLVQGRGSP